MWKLKVFQYSFLLFAFFLLVFCSNFLEHLNKFKNLRFQSMKQVDKMQLFSYILCEKEKSGVSGWPQIAKRTNASCLSRKFGARKYFLGWH